MGIKLKGKQITNTISICPWYGIGIITSVKNKRKENVNGKHRLGGGGGTFIIDQAQQSSV